MRREQRKECHPGMGASCIPPTALWTPTGKVAPDPGIGSTTELIFSIECSFLCLLPNIDIQ